MQEKLHRSLATQIDLIDWVYWLFKPGFRRLSVPYRARTIQRSPKPAVSRMLQPVLTQQGKNASQFTCFYRENVTASSLTLRIALRYPLKRRIPQSIHLIDLSTRTVAKVESGALRALSASFQSLRWRRTVLTRCEEVTGRSS